MSCQNGSISIHPNEFVCFSNHHLRTTYILFFHLFEAFEAPHCTSASSPPLHADALRYLPAIHFYNRTYPINASPNCISNNTTIPWCNFGTSSSSLLCAMIVSPSLCRLRLSSLAGIYYLLLTMPSPRLPEIASCLCLQNKLFLLLFLHENKHPP
jgi:hypothetical protein